MSRNYVITEAGKETVYRGFNKHWPADGAEAVALVADEDSIEVLTLEDPDHLNGIHAYIDDTPCTRLLGVYIPYFPAIEKGLLDHFNPADMELAKAIAHRLPPYLRAAFAAMVKPHDHA